MRSDTQPKNGNGERGLAYCSPAISEAAPRYLESDRIAPVRAIGLGSKTTLKATFWQCTIEETDQVGDPDFVSIALNTGGGRVWRNNEQSPTGVGAIALQPFEGARWRFEQPVEFVHLYVPFGMLAIVCESLFGRALDHSDLIMPSGERDERLCRTAHAVQAGLSSIEPTSLILDSWALILAENLVHRFSSHAGRPMHAPFGKLPARRVAHVVDYIEAGLDGDLDLASLAGVAAMSTYHFARRFKETVGMSPHAYVLQRRVHRAAHLLERRHLGLAQIAAASGFSSQAHMTTAFRRRFALTPAAYRRARHT